MEKVRELAAVAGTSIIKRGISTAHRLGTRKQDKTRPITVRFMSRRKRAELMRNKSKLKDADGYEDVFISEDLTCMRYKLSLYAKDKCQHTFIREGKVICKNDGRYVTINTPDDLFMIGYDDVDCKDFGIGV